VIITCDAGVSISSDGTIGIAAAARPRNRARATDLCLRELDIAPEFAFTPSTSLSSYSP
jgi:hypothetical protein